MTACPAVTLSSGYKIPVLGLGTYNNFVLNIHKNPRVAYTWLDGALTVYREFVFGEPATGYLYSPTTMLPDTKMVEHLVSHDIMCDEEYGKYNYESWDVDFLSKNHEAVGESVKEAVDAGYRYIDTAWVYLCEPAVGRALRQKIEEGVVKREDLFICSKLWSDRHAFVEESVMESLNDLGLSYLDLYIIHHPVSVKRRERIQNLEDSNATFEPGHVDFMDTWRDMEKLVDKGLVRSIGLSNFTIPQITRILKDPSLRHKPAYLQVEVHPYFSNSELVDFCKQEGIVVAAYAPLGRAGTDYGLAPTENVLQDPVLNEIGANYRKTPAQVALRWIIQRGLTAVVKSLTPARIQSNFQIFDFELTFEEMASISALDRGLRLATFETLKNMPEYPF